MLSQTVGLILSTRIYKHQCTHISQVCDLNKLLEDANMRNQQLNLRLVSLEGDVERARAEAALAVKEKQNLERECHVSLLARVQKHLNAYI
jgi:hypothetical protein